MFGEKDIIGNEVLKVDSRKRIILPKFTYAEENDELIVLKLNDYISIHTLSSFEKRIEKLHEEYKESDFNTKKRIMRITKFLYSNIVNVVKCESNRRISLANEIMDEKEFICVGCKDHVKLKIK